MSCVATPAHASEPFEWHSAERNNPVNCFARGRQHSAEQNNPVNCFVRGKRVDLREQGKQATENCFISLQFEFFRHLQFLSAYCVFSRS